MLASSSEQNLAAAAKAVAAEGPQPLTVAGDLRKLEACEQLFKRVNERFQRCDVLVNNAGATRAGAFLELPDAVWLDGFALKFFGCVRLTRLFWPLLKASQGSVVNIVGGAARTPDAEFLIGGAVNAAVANFSKGLSKLGNRDNVNVNVIHPGNTDTERQDELRRQRAAALGRTVDELRAEALTKSNRRRFGKPEDIAALALFLCSERAPCDLVHIVLPKSRRRRNARRSNQQPSTAALIPAARGYCYETSVRRRAQVPQRPYSQM